MKKGSLAKARKLIWDIELQAQRWKGFAKDRKYLMNDLEFIADKAIELRLLLNSKK